MAAGFTVKAEKIDEMRWRLNRNAGEVLSENDLGRTLTADAEICAQQVTVAIARSLARLEPHGVGNPAPLFLMRKAPLRSVQLLKQKHLKLSIGAEKDRIDALWWNAAEHQSKLSGSAEVSLMCRLEINKWNSRENCQLKVVDAAIE